MATVTTPSTRAARRPREAAGKADSPTRKQLIQKAAQQHFVAHGFEGASMREIAADAGITIATLYFHVGTKEQLFLDILQAQRQRLWDGIQAALAAAGPSWTERLSAAITFHVISRCEPGAGPLLHVGDLQRMTGTLREQYMGRRDQYEHLFRDLIKGGIAAGEFAPVDDTVVAAGIIGIGNTVALWFRPEGRLSPLQIAEQYVALLLSGMQPRG